MQTHEGGRYVLLCDAPGCNARYTASKLSTQQDALALSTREDWLNVGASNFCPDHVRKTEATEMEASETAEIPATTPTQPGAGEAAETEADKAGAPPKAADAITPLETEAGAETQTTLQSA